MDYQKHYDLLVTRARKRLISGYVERHHIIPKCMGGDNSESNIVKLTAPEHYLAHQLLVKIYPGHKGLIWSAMAMTQYANKNRERSLNKTYGWLRKKFRIAVIQANTGRKVSEETRKKMSQAKTGKKQNPHSEETKIKMSEASKGKCKSTEHKTRLSESKTGKKRASHSEATKIKISETNKATWARKDKSQYQLDEYKKKQSESMKKVWENRKSQTAT